MNNCKNCGNAIFDQKLGEYKCYVKQRTCVGNEVAMGCSEWSEKRAVKVEEKEVRKDGATFIPSVSTDGVISWTNNQNLPNPAAVNIKGPKGDPGEKGDPGKDGVIGADGKDGEDGLDGFSPVVAVEDIDGGHRVTITDAEGAKTFDVMDGKDGEGGSGGGSADWSVNDPEADGYVKNRTHWEEKTAGKTSFTSEEIFSVEPINIGAMLGADYFPAYKFSDTVFDLEYIAEIKINDFSVFSDPNWFSFGNLSISDIGNVDGNPFVMYAGGLDGLGSVFALGIFSDDSVFPRGIYVIPLHLFYEFTDAKFSIELPESTYEKLNEKYIPNIFTVRVVEDDSGELVSDKTYNEIFAHIRNGDAVLAIYKEIVFCYAYCLTLYGNSTAFVFCGYSEHMVTDDEKYLGIQELTFFNNNRIQLAVNSIMSFRPYTLRLSDRFLSVDNRGIVVAEDSNGAGANSEIIPNESTVQAMIDAAIAKLNL